MTTMQPQPRTDVAPSTATSEAPSVAATPSVTTASAGPTVVPPVATSVSPSRVPGTPSGRLTGQARSDRTRELFTQALGASEEVVQQLHDQVIVMHLELAHAEAKRYRSRGVALDDLRQVAALALTKAANGYDVTSGHDFLSYAVPTIRGELRKHFRDHGWMVRPPRRIQELQARINHADGELSNGLGRAPRPQEIAEHLDEPLASVTEALASDGCFVPASLDHPAGGGDGTTSLGDLLPLDDADHRASEARLLLQPVLRHLSERDRAILSMRFHEGLTQREIAGRIGVTQMQVSRLLGRILGQLRDDVGDVSDTGSDS
ncbi:sigma-70 family RNA polymerase sigma factor [Nocardioides aequoreus]|uniref:sigma-70 family RNA polymerase sigma factor n=1 Tax=Nocardioides aequoreus TaxID=397278 RepID=UPI000691AACF|nr:sigma-70 family RNA polymerase sigma factor [Nocardioides aequoreus]